MSTSSKVISAVASLSDFPGWSESVWHSINPFYLNYSYWMLQADQNISINTNCCVPLLFSPYGRYFQTMGTWTQDFFFWTTLRRLTQFLTLLQNISATPEVEKPWLSWHAHIFHEKCSFFVVVCHSIKAPFLFFNSAQQWNKSLYRLKYALFLLESLVENIA